MTPKITVRNVFKTFPTASGEMTAIQDFSLDVPDGEFLCIVGPSGCGKSTLLRILAGLIEQSAGDVTVFPGDDPHKPLNSVVFQEYAIFPWMTVRDNVAFGLRMRGVAKKARYAITDDWLERIGLLKFAEYYPAQLSGGMKQRVSIARALANDPEVLLMDEPLSNLDVLLRAQMRVDLKRLLRTIKTTTLYVTHDQTEAMNMGDRIAIMNQGELMQIDTPTAIYDLPETQFIAGFIGHPPMNFLYPQVRRHNGTVKAYLGDFEIEPPAPFIAPLRRYEGDEVILGIRAENIMAYDAPTADALPATVTAIDELGAKNLLTTGVGAETVIVSTLPSFPARINGPIWLQFPPDKIRWMDRETGRALKPDLEISAAE